MPSKRAIHAKWCSILGAVSMHLVLSRVLIDMSEFRILDFASQKQQVMLLSKFQELRHIISGVFEAFQLTCMTPPSYNCAAAYHSGPRLSWN